MHSHILLTPLGNWHSSCYTWRDVKCSRREKKIDSTTRSRAARLIQSGSNSKMIYISVRIGRRNSFLIFLPIWMDAGKCQMHFAFRRSIPIDSLKTKQKNLIPLDICIQLVTHFSTMILEIYNITCENAPPANRRKSKGRFRAKTAMVPAWTRSEAEPWTRND